MDIDSSSIKTKETQMNTITHPVAIIWISFFRSEIMQKFLVYIELCIEIHHGKGDDI